MYFLVLWKTKYKCHPLLCRDVLILYFISWSTYVWFNIFNLFVFEIFLSILLYKLLKTMISFSADLGYLYTIIIMIYNFECCIYTFFICFNFRLWQGTETLFPSWNLPSKKCTSLEIVSIIIIYNMVITCCWHDDGI